MGASPLIQANPHIGAEFSTRAIKAVVFPIQLLLSAPSVLFFGALTAMLLRPPDLSFYQIDRVAFALLVFGIAGRSLLLKEPLMLAERIAWPMFGLIALAFVSIVRDPFDCETWSLLASRFIVPFTMFHLAALVFTSEKRWRQFEIFVLVVLAYLSFTSIAFLVGAHSLIFPRFILDESLGFHADRARGPLLQAVANGVSLNMLGLLALHAYQRGTVRGSKIVLLLASVPVAILATMTRAVWLSFAGTVLAVIFTCAKHRWRTAGVLLVTAALAAASMIAAPYSALNARLEERESVEFRTAVYAGSWQMFLDHPLTGWGFHQMPSELPRYVDGYDEKVLYPHNSYLETLVELGAPGLALYLWLMLELLRLARGAIPANEKTSFLDAGFHRLWPILLAVYWVNAAFVAMNYQFVNALLFTLAGMLAAQRRRAESFVPC